MAQAKRTTLTTRDDHPARRNATVRPLTLTERIRQRLQARRLKRLLDELDEQHGPIPAEAMERARRSWPED